MDENDVPDGLPDVLAPEDSEPIELVEAEPDDALYEERVCGCDDEDDDVEITDDDEDEV